MCIQIQYMEGIGFALLSTPNHMFAMKYKFVFLICVLGVERERTLDTVVVVVVDLIFSMSYLCGVVVSSCRVYFSLLSFYNVPRKFTQKKTDASACWWSYFSFCFFFVFCFNISSIFISYSKNYKTVIKIWQWEKMESFVLYDKKFNIINIAISISWT